MSSGANMLPNAEAVPVLSTDEIFAQTGDFSMHRQPDSTPPTLDVVAFLRSIADGYFSGPDDTFRLGVSDAV
jgi:hypothetical protein